MNRLPATVNLTWLLVWLNAFIWFGFSVYTALGGIPSLVRLGAMRWIMVFLAAACAAVLAGIALGLRKRLRIAFYLALLVFTVLSVLSVTDEIGLLDVISLLISVLPFALLLKDRAWYLSSVA